MLRQSLRDFNLETKAISLHYEIYEATGLYQYKNRGQDCIH